MLHNPMPLTYLAVGASAVASLGLEDNSTLSALSELKLTPTVVAASTLSPIEASGLVGAIGGQVGLHTTLHALRQGESDALATDLQLTDTIRRNPADKQANSLWQAHVAQLTQILGEIDSVRNKLQAAANQSMGSKQSKSIALISNQERAVPPEFWTLSLNEEGWTTLEEALVAERRASRLGTALPSDISKLLANYRADPEVVIAQKGLDDNLELIEQVWPK